MTTSNEFDPMTQLPVDMAVQTGDQPDDPGPTAGAPTVHAPPGMGTTTPPNTTNDDDNPDNPETPRTMMRRVTQTAAVAAQMVAGTPSPRSSLGEGNDGDSPDPINTTTNRQQQGGTGAASSGEEGRGCGVPMAGAPFVKSMASPPARMRPQQTEAEVSDRDNLVNILMDQVTALQAEVGRLSRKLAVQDIANGNANGQKDEVPHMNNKDIEKPFKYNGEKWAMWESDFKNFLVHRDQRWKLILDTIKKKSDKPIGPETLEEIRKNAGLQKDNVYEAFAQQLYEYLKSYTSGEANTLIMVNTPEKAFESWRRLCDQGRSIRDRPLRDEKRALFHPKQVTAENLIKTIADWEKRLNLYVMARPKDGMEDQDKIMCLEDMCPEPIQKYLSDKAQLGHLKSYEAYKDAIDVYFYEEKRWARSSRPRVSALNEAEGQSAGDEEVGLDPDSSKTLAAVSPSDWATALMGEINALVKGKLRNKGIGKGNTGGKANHPMPMEVDSTGDASRAKVDDRKCYECGEAGHIGRNCAIRQARVAAGGPAIIKGDGKGGKKGKGGGKSGQGGQQWPSAQQWRSMYPGPSMQTWSSWQPAKGGKASLFEAPAQLSAFNALFQGPSAFTIAPKKKTVPPRHTDTEKVSYESVNKFKALEEDENEIGKKMEVKITDAIKPPSRNQERKKATKIGKKVDFNNVNDELIDFICGKTKKLGNLNMFNEVRGPSCICPVTGTQTPTSSMSSPGKQDFRGTIDPTKWEVMHAVVDSGATVPVLHPKTGEVYQVEESPASRAGVEYEIANGSTLPCLGQKHMAVMTEEGTLRGYTSQCADVSKALQAVRSMVGSRHAVCFGLGPAGEDHLIINRESGEINRMIDDGINYLQKLFVVPPDQVEAVQERLQQDQCFGRRGR